LFSYWKLPSSLKVFLFYTLYSTLNRSL
jgi:hypothetical protein